MPVALQIGAVVEGLGDKVALDVRGQVEGIVLHGEVAVFAADQVTVGIIGHAVVEWHRSATRCFNLRGDLGYGMRAGVFGQTVQAAVGTDLVLDMIVFIAVGVVGFGQDVAQGVVAVVHAFGVLNGLGCGSGVPGRDGPGSVDQSGWWLHLRNHARCQPVQLIIVELLF